MTFKIAYQKFCKAHSAAEAAGNDLAVFFSDFDLEYSITYCKGDGVLMLDQRAGLCASLSKKNVDDLSAAKNREDVLSVISKLQFNF